MSHDKNVNESIIEGRNAVMEAFRSGKPVDKLYVLDGCQDGAVRSIIREARKHDTILNFVPVSGIFQDPLLCRIVYIYQSESLRITFCPFKVIHQ